MKVAFATEDLANVDAHFGWARNFAVYEVTPQGYRFLEAIRFGGELTDDGNEDKLTPKIDAVRDCAIVYVAAIGGSAAARVVAARIHPVKVPRPEPIVSILDKLQAVLEKGPPPWLRKCLQKGEVRRFDLDEEAEHA